MFHIANGHATTRLLTLAGIPGETSVWADPLHDGPVPAGLDASALRAVRAKHIAAMAGDVAATAVLEPRTDWDAALTHAASGGELVLWFEHDLFDQLNLIHLLDRIVALPAMPRAVSLICIGTFPGHPGFKGLGELAPGEIASLLDTRRPVTGAQYALALLAWSAFRSDDPRTIEALLAEGLSALPFLASALRRLLEEFPSTHDGLSRTERRVLELAAGGPIDQHTVFARMHAGETSFFMADASFFAIVRGLAALTPPLLTVDAERIDATPAGRDVLNGAADRVRLCGIDRWLGGVHLEGHGQVWRWDGVALTRA